MNYFCFETQNTALLMSSLPKPKKERESTFSFRNIEDKCSSKETCNAVMFTLSTPHL